MKTGLKYVTYTNTALIDLEKAFNKTIEEVSPAKQSEVSTKSEKLEMQRLLKDKIAKEENEHRISISPAKDEEKQLTEEKKTYDDVNMMTTKNDGRNCSTFQN